MAINWDKYKTYDDSKGKGNANAWRLILESILGKNFEEYIFDDKFFKQFEFNESRFKQKSNGNNIFGAKFKVNKNKFFSGCKNMIELKSEFRKLMMIHHPDKGGNEETCKSIIAEYEKMSYKLSEVKL